mmetsp:Transcript_58509/g.67571  ORF Transcript_58509/g.67571 Transcript_58509/m.67571 type:complete len:386 (+) Transcript_58509:47-1204(+)
MGIYKLMDLIREKAPNAIRTVQLDLFAGKTVACDASMAIYQFIIATQGYNQANGLTELTDKEGNKTGHLVGLMNRTIMFMENGIKPIWVFDGKPPLLKSGELAKRKKAKEEAKDRFEEAQEVGDFETALKQKVRSTLVTKTMIEDAKKMLRLLGVPVIEAPCEAEAECAELVKAGKAYATATEDMDALTFGTKYLLRGFNNKKEPIYEVAYDEMIKGFDMTHDEFVDLCILCGCDYTETVDGVGPVTAFKLIKEHKTLEKVIERLKKDNEDPKRKKKYVIPEPFNYEDARELFVKPKVLEDTDKIEIKFNKPDQDALKQFLVEEKGFSETRVDNAVNKMKAVDTKGHQSRLDSFFGKPVVVKRKEPESASASKGKGSAQSMKKKK